ncbi:hypothetical protein ACNOYE_02730 [Nannocystaceae bacterium ST9]
MSATAMRSDPSSYTHGIQRSLRDAAEAARTIDTRSYELASHARVRAELAPVVRTVMNDAIAVLGDVLARFDQPQVIDAAEDSGVFNCVLDDLVTDTSPSNPYQRVADISFMARWELERKRGAITEAERGDDEWRLIAECCSARRRVIKAASGVERVLSEVEALPSLFTSLFQTERQRAVETRAAYYNFVVGTRAAMHWQERDLQRCLRLIGTGIALLVGRPIYEDLRIEDRRALRSLQMRLVGWLRGDRDPLAGQRLVSECSAFASLLMDVNRRPVLIEHDRELLERLLAAVMQPATNKSAFYQVLISLRGRDATLDHLIEHQADLRPELWVESARATLASLRERDHSLS